MEYRDYTSELAGICASCKKDIYGMFMEKGVSGFTFNNDEDEELVLTVYEGDGEYHERTMEFCKFLPKSERLPYERLFLTDVEGHEYTVDDLTENDLMVLYDAVYNHLYQQN